MKVKKFDEKDLGANPFVQGDFKIVVRKLTNFEKLAKDADGTYLPTEDTLEQDKFVRVYVNNKKLNKLDEVGVEQMSAHGTELFFWILFRLTAGQDYFILDKEKFMREKKIGSINTYKKGLHELIKKGLIKGAETVRNVYWINPRFFFCGSRVNKYGDKVVEYEPKKKENDKQIQP